MIRVGAFVLVTMLGLLVLSLCRVERSGEPSPRPDSRERLVSLAPNLTEVVILLGAREQLVGVTRFCEGIEESVARLGGYKPDYEKILSLRPDRVFAIETEIQRKGLDFLRQHGIEVDVVRAESIDDIRSIVLSLVCDTI